MNVGRVITSGATALVVLVVLQSSGCVDCPKHGPQHDRSGRRSVAQRDEGDARRTRPRRTGTPQTPPARQDTPPSGAPEQPLPRLVRLDDPRFFFVDHEGNHVDAREFIRPWSPVKVASTIEAWKLTVRDIAYDSSKLQPGGYYVQYPQQTWARKQGVCIDTAILLCSWLLDMKKNAYVAIGEADLGSGAGGHAWTLLRDSKAKKTYLLETSIDTNFLWKAIRELDLPDAERYEIEGAFNQTTVFATTEAAQRFQ